MYADPGGCQARPVIKSASGLQVLSVASYSRSNGALSCLPAASSLELEGGEQIVCSSISLAQRLEAEAPFDELRIGVVS